MSLESFLRTVQVAPSSTASFVEGACRNVTVAGAYFTVPSWDSGKHVFGPAPWSGGTEPAPGDRVLVVFLGTGVDHPWVIAASGGG